MGGYGSGSWYRYKKTYADESRTLDINRMVKLGAIPKCGWKAGGWIWTDTETGETTSSIGYESNTTSRDNSYLRIHYTITDSQEKIDYKVRLSRSHTQFGGERLWFICPCTGKRVVKLVLPYGGDIFASRHAYGLAYSSQSETPTDRAISRMWKLKNRLGGENYWRKPKGMHKKTHERMIEKVWEAEAEADAYLAQFILQRFGKLEGFS